MFSCLFYDNMAQDSATIENGCGSSVVEHSLGKGEVESSILSRSTILFLFCPSPLSSINLLLSAQKSPPTQLSPNTVLHNTRNENTTPSLPSVKKNVNHQLSVNLKLHETALSCPSNPQHKNSQPPISSLTAPISCLQSTSPT